MKLVKHVDLSVSPVGELQITDNPKGSVPIYSGPLEISKFHELIKWSCPPDFELNYLPTLNDDVFVEYEHKHSKLRLEFKVVFGPNDVTGYYDFRGKDTQLFYYFEGQPFNSMSWFKNVYNILASDFWKHDGLKNLIRAYIPDIRFHKEYKPHFVNPNDPIRWVADISGRMQIVVTVKNGFPIILGQYQTDGDNYMSWIETIDDKIRKMKDLKAEISTLESLIEDAKTIKLTREELITQDKIDRKNLAEIYRKLPRNSQLEKHSTRYLIGMLNLERKSPGETGFHLEELKIELSHREHVPNKQEARLIRQQRAKHGNRKSKNK